VRHDLALKLVRGMMIPGVVKSGLIPRGSREEWNLTRKIMSGNWTRKVECVDPHRCVSPQKIIRGRNLCYAMRHWRTLQKDRDTLPVVVSIGRGRFYVWDGNHRTTAALMLGKRRMRAMVYRQEKPTCLAVHKR
jgi:hypothetical protein